MTKCGRETVEIFEAYDLARQGDTDTATAILGTLALSPDSTLATEHLAKATLAGLLGDNPPR